MGSYSLGLLVGPLLGGLIYEGFQRDNDSDRVFNRFHLIESIIGIQVDLVDHGLIVDCVSYFILLPGWRVQVSNER